MRCIAGLLLAIGMMGCNGQNGRADTADPSSARFRPTSNSAIAPIPDSLQITARLDGSIFQTNDPIVAKIDCHSKNTDVFESWKTCRVSVEIRNSSSSIVHTFVDEFPISATTEGRQIGPITIIKYTEVGKSPPLREGNYKLTMKLVVSGVATFESEPITIEVKDIVHQ